MSIIRCVLTLSFLSSMLLLNLEGFSQKEAYRWYFGRKAGLDFSTTPPTMLSNSPNPGGLDVEEAHASISDADGNFLFYTNGETIWDNTGTAMPNGTLLQGHWSSTQCATVFPRPGSTSEYYIVTSPVTGSTTQLRWNLLDMTLNGGKGDIKTPVASNKNMVLPSCPSYVMEAITSVPHFNGTDIWIIAHTADNPSTAGVNEGGSFLVWLVTSAGITYSNSYTLGYAYPQAGGSSRGIGILKANTCFNRLFISYYNESSRVEGFSFNNTTGAVSNWPAPISAPLVIDEYRNSSGVMTTIGSFSYGLEISGNGRYLYNTISGETGPKEITQYDLQAGAGTNADIENSAVRLTPASPDGARYGQLQIGPDGKIYHSLHNWGNIGAGGYCKVSVINNPNTGGAGANYVEAAYTWPGTATGVGSTMGLPSFHKGFLAGKAAITSTLSNLEEICLGDAVDFTAQTAGAGVTMYQWNIDKNLNATIDYSGAASSTINHTYGATGTYTVELTVTDNCGYTYASESQVKVLPKTTTAASISCSPTKGNITLPDATKSYVWYSDAAMTKPIATGSSNVTLPIAGAGTVYVRAESSVTSGSSSSTLRNTGSMNTWAGGAGTTVTFTVNNPITLNSFQWGNGSIPGWPYPSTTYSVAVQNSAGTVTFYTNSYTTADGSTSYNTYTENGLNIVLPAGNYRIVYSSVGADWSANTNASDANVSITGLPGKIANFNYSVNTYTVTQLACSVPATVAFDCPLPVTWLDFSGYRTNDGSVSLLWSTSSEKNNKGFIIQRSLNGIDFENIDIVDGAGNSNQVLSYSFVDSNAPYGRVYYRLEQIDFDGKSSYSSIVFIGVPNGANISLVPNPGNNKFSITGISGEVELNISILSLTGQLMFEGSSYAGQGIELNGLPKGVYLVKIQSAEENYIVKYINE